MKLYNKNDVFIINYNFGSMPFHFIVSVAKRWQVFFSTPEFQEKICQGRVDLKRYGTILEKDFGHIDRAEAEEILAKLQAK